MPGELTQMRAVDAIVRTIVSNPDDIVYISGSLIEGFGNASSDIDVFLVTAQQPEYRGPFGSVLGDFYLDLEVYRRGHMLELASRLNALDPADFRSVWLTPLAELDLYYRTLIGEAAHNPDGFASLRASFRRDVIERLLGAWCGLRYAASLQHAREELDARRPVNAALAGQAAAAFALDAYLAAHGEAFPSLKWRFDKLARLQGAESGLYRRAWQLKAAGSQDPAAYLEAVAGLGEEQGMQAYSAWSLDDVPLQRTGDSRSYEIAGDAYVVQDRRFVYGVDAGLRGVFDLLGAEADTRAGLARELARASGVSETEAADRVRGAIAALQARSLVRAY